MTTIDTQPCMCARSTTPPTINVDKLVHSLYENISVLSKQMLQIMIVCILYDTEVFKHGQALGLNV